MMLSRHRQKTMLLLRLSVTLTCLSLLTRHIYAVNSIYDVVTLAAIGVGAVALFNDDFDFFNEGDNEDDCEDCFTECDTNSCGNGDCLENEEDGTTTCLCPSGFTGTGTTSCTADACSTTPCGANGDCSLSPDATNGYVCRCNTGFRFNGVTCVNDACNGNTCGTNGACVIDSAGNSKCCCNEDYEDRNGVCVQRCPSGTVKFDTATDGICFYPAFDHYNQENAEEACEDAYADGGLAPLPNEAVQDFIDEGKFFAFTQSGSNDGFWIGIEDSEEEGTYVDTLGNTITGEDRNFETGQPNDSNTENCVVVLPEESFQWHDAPCTNTYQALCSVNIEL